MRKKNQYKPNRKIKNMITIKTLNTVQRELNENKEFVQSSEYCVVEPGLSGFYQDEIIQHQSLLIYLTKENLNSVNLLPHCSI